MDEKSKRDSLLYKIKCKIYTKINRGLICLFKICPIRNDCFIFESEGDFSDNIRAFYDFLIERDYNKKYKIIWIVSNPNRFQAKYNVEFLTRSCESINWKLDYYIATAKLFMFSHPYWLKKWRKKQIVLYTTHSVAALKYCKPRTDKICDYILNCSEFCKEQNLSVFNIKEENALILGFPRLDMLYRHKDCLKYFFDKSTKKKFIISMETYKQSTLNSDGDIVNRYAINVVRNEKELKQFDDFLEENGFVLIVKIHHLQDLSFLQRVNLNNIKFLTDDELSKYDIQVNELLENADILLTDYSSVFYDFILLDRPIGFTIGDMSEYTRGFIVDNIFDEMPGEKIRSLQELEKFLIDFNNGIDHYKNFRNKIRDKAFEFQDNKNSERLFKWLETILTEKEGM